VFPVVVVNAEILTKTTEIDAARAAGMAARLVIRKGNAAVSDEDGQRLDAIHDFLELVEAFDKPPYLAVVDEEVEKEA